MVQVSTRWGAAACLLLLVGCGQQPLELKEFSPGDGLFKILMPGTPKEQAGPLGTKIYGSELRGGAFMVSVTDALPANAPENEIQGRLDGGVDGAVKGVGGTIVNSSKITLAGKYPGRDYTANANKDGKKAVVRGRMYAVKTRLYQIVVIGSKSFVDSPDATKVFDSFSVKD